MMFLLVSLLSLSAHADSYTATYEVPAPADLAPYAQLNVGYRISTDENGQTTLAYSLPATLLGQERDFTLSGVVPPGAKAFSLHGADADMTCDASGSVSVTCQVQHHNVVVDLAGVQSALDATGMSPEEKAGHLRLAAFVARAGGGDLMGVIRYHKP